MNQKLQKTGVYKIISLINNKFYIGSTQVSYYKRWNSHLHALRKNKHHSKYLQNTYNKYGENNLKFEILNNCPKEYCLKLEQKLINILNPEYNICKDVRGRRGLPVSQETRDKISKTLKGRKRNFIISKESIQQGAIKKYKKIIQLTKNGDFIKEWASLKEAVSNLNINQAYLSRSLKENHRICGGFKWKYK